MEGVKKECGGAGSEAFERYVTAQARMEKPKELMKMGFPTLTTPVAA